MLNNELYEKLSTELNETLYSHDWDYTETINAKEKFNELLNLEANLLNNWDLKKSVAAN